MNLYLLADAEKGNAPAVPAGREKKMMSAEIGRNSGLELMTVPETTREPRESADTMRLQTSLRKP